MSITRDRALSQSLSLIKGDSDEYLVTITEGVGSGATPVNLDQAVDGTDNRKAILRFSVKLTPSREENEDALIYKESYYPDQIKVLDQTLTSTRGKVEILIDKPDTLEGRISDSYSWDLEVSLQDVERSNVSGVGTATAELGSNIIVGSSTQFSQAKLFDIINLLDVDNLNKPALITRIISDTELEVSRNDWVDVSGGSFEVRRGRHRTAAAGSFALKQDVVTDKAE